MKRLFLYGDSISMQYQPYLEALLQSHFTIARKGDGMPLDDLSDMRVNGGDSRMMASYFEKTDIRADILLFNAGLHDSRIFPNGQRQVPLVEYAQNILKTIHLARAKRPFPVFITTTQVNPDMPGNNLFFRCNEEIQIYNQAAVAVCRASWIPVIQLGEFTKGFQKDHYIDNVHFSKTGSLESAAYIANTLNKWKVHE